MKVYVLMKEYEGIQSVHAFKDCAERTLDQRVAKWIGTKYEESSRNEFDIETWEVQS